MLSQTHINNLGMIFSNNFFVQDSQKSNILDYKNLSSDSIDLITH